MANKVTVKALKLTRELLLVSAAPADNVYVAGGVTLNLSPGNILDPQALGVVGPSQLPAVPPGVFSENLSGYYAQVVPGATLATFKLQYFQPGGAEVAAGAYPAQITGGHLVLSVPFES